MRFLLKLAWQDLRGSGQSLWVLCACLVLGVTLVAATGGLYQQVWAGLQADSRKVSGGDLQVESRSRLPTEAVSWMEARGQVSLLIELDTMMGTTSGGFQLVEVQSVDEHYPLYGELTLDPPLPLADVTRKENGRFGLAMDPVHECAGPLVLPGEFARLATPIPPVERQGQFRLHQANHRSAEPRRAARQPKNGRSQNRRGVLG